MIIMMMPPGPEAVLDGQDDAVFGAKKLVRAGGKRSGRRNDGGKRRGRGIEEQKNSR